jgi:hypothetical protein
MLGQPQRDFDAVPLGGVRHEACETATGKQTIRIMHERMELNFVWNLARAMTIAASGVRVGDGC